MTVREMHYDFKQKLNEIDNAKYRKLKVPEIDWKLNEAQDVFIKTIVEPRYREDIGFEFNQRTIDDIKTLVVDQKYSEGQLAQIFDSKDMSYIVALPTDYKFYTNSSVYANKGNCLGVRLEVKEMQHDDKSETSVFDVSSFIWRIANVRFNKDGLRVFTGGGDFVVDRVCFDYIKEPPFIHNAQDAQGGTYTTLSGTVLTGFQNCILPINTHRELVDLAVFITANDLTLPNTANKQGKVQLDQ